MRHNQDYDERIFKIVPRVSTAMARNDKFHLNGGLTRDISPELDRKLSAEQKFRPLVGPPSCSN